MTPEEQIEQTLKAQVEAQTKSLKQQARFEALRFAAGLKTIDSENNPSPMTPDNIISTCDKIYDWLTKDIQP